MTNIDGKFGGEIRFDPIKYSKVLTRVVYRHNKSSGKIIVPYDYIDTEVIVLFPHKIKKKRT